MFKKKGLLVGGIVVAFLGGMIYAQQRGAGVIIDDDLASAHVTVYKSPTCGCCGNYASYLRKNGFDVEVVETRDMDSIKLEHGVPGHLESCHTTVFDDGSVVEGHVPIEAMRAMMSDDSVDHIGMSGMPSGSPGMPGPKMSAFSVHSYESDGSSQLFIEL